MIRFVPIPESQSFAFYNTVTCCFVAISGAQSFPSVDDLRECLDDHSDGVPLPRSKEELIEMAKKFRAAAQRGEELGLTEDEVRFYDALADNESAVRELSDETLKKISHELTENLRQNITVDWFARESVRAKLRLMVQVARISWLTR